MKMTRSEASQKWCPMTRPENDNSCKCIADRCAGWRWLPVTNPDNGARKAVLADNPLARTEEEAGPRYADGWEFSPASIKPYTGWGEDSPAQWIEPQEEANQRRRGYCGLAGKPEPE